MSSTFSNVRIWNVVDNKYVTIEASEGMTDDITLITPQTVPSDSNVYLLAGAMSDGKFGLQIVNPFDVPELQGAEGIQGPQGIQGIQGVPGVNGTNGLGFTYVGSNLPSNPQDGETWLEIRDFPLSKLSYIWQYTLGKWWSIEETTVNFQRSQTTAALNIDVAFNDGHKNSHLVTSIKFHAYCYGLTNPTNYWRVVYQANHIANGGQVGGDSGAVNLINLTTDLGGGYIEADLITQPVEFTQRVSWYRISTTRIGNPGAIAFVGSISARRARS